METEPNDTTGTAQAVTLDSGDVLTTPINDWLNISGSVLPFDADFYQFTLNAPAGVFFDLDARLPGLAGNLNAELTVRDASGTTIGANGDGFDYHQITLPATSTPTPLGQPDPATYLDLAAGTYTVSVSATGFTAGDYVLRMLADTNYTTTVPVFHSNPGASNTLFLDFDGQSGNDGWGAYTAAAFDFNGDTSQFTPAERLAMHNIAKVVAEDFSPFDVDITTVDPATFPVGDAMRLVITSSDSTAIGHAAGELGAAMPGSFATGSRTAFVFGGANNVNFSFASNVAAGVSGVIMPHSLEMGNIASQQLGRTMRLKHYGGDNANVDAIMNGPDTGLSRKLWYAGRTSTIEDPLVVDQDDMYLISLDLGYRADDHGNTRALATGLTPAGDVITTSGVIERVDAPADVDYFRFTVPSGGGVTAITADVDEFSNNLDIELSLFDSGGMQVGATIAPGSTFDASFSPSLSGGTYYLEVASQGQPGEAGQYNLRIVLPNNGESDFGDAPASYGTELIDNGARHVNTGPILGTLRDSEINGQPNATATGDGADEDGVSAIPTLLQGQQTTLTVTLSNAADALLDLWIDFDRDGAFDPVSERITSPAGQMLSSGDNTLMFTTPIDAHSGTSYARFRVSTAGGLNPTGAAADGEVEDYAVTIGDLDFGDAPDTYSTSIALDGPRHLLIGPMLGLSRDAESDANTPLDGTGDGDDEDGVTNIPMLTPGQAAAVSVLVAGAASGVVDAWIDFNGDGLFDPTDERITALAGTTFMAGSTPLPFLVPDTARSGPTYARFRISSTGGLDPTGLATDGEVEDYAVTIAGLDYGDAPDTYGTLYVNNGARHAPIGPTLGLTRDAEDDAVDPLDGTGDGDDEDGVTGIPTLIPGKMQSLSVTVNGGPAFLHAWIDFNADNIFEAGEEITPANGLSVTNGVNNVPFTTAADAVGGMGFARFRLVSMSGPLASDGFAPNGEVEDYAVTMAEVDFGDAPDSYGTIIGSDGARHADIGPTLGATRDTEIDAELPLDGSGDGDDEDGVTLPAALIAGADQSAQVEVAGVTDAALLDAWIDFDGNGLFDPAERITPADGLAVVNGSNTVTFTTPIALAAPGTTYARFRLSSVGGLAPNGVAPDGEVEDYAVAIAPLDFGDAPDTFGTTLAVDGARHVATGLTLGATRDSESDGQPNLLANGDGADEDGVAFDFVALGEMSQVTVYVAGNDGLLDAWIDFNGDGEFDATAERITPAAGQDVTIGANLLTFMVPPDASTDPTFARFRLSTAGGLTPTGPAEDGEVEDYRVVFTKLDFGDAPNTYGTLRASDGARHAQSALKLGALFDTEPDAAAPLDTTGDDDDGMADEDGVTFDPLVQGTVANMQVTVSGIALGAFVGLDAWIDFNGNGAFDDPSERITPAAGAPVTAGSQFVPFNVPITAVGGDTVARVRISYAGGLAPTGLAPNGEVEDYTVSLRELDFGDAPDSYSTLASSDGARHVAAGLTLGATRDSESDGQPSVNADGDGADEDGVTFTLLVQDEMAAATVLSSAAGGMLDAWIDFNRDGVFDPVGERITDPAGDLLNSTSQAINFDVPADALPGATYARFRISAGGGLDPTGLAPDGEVEDYRVTIVGFDFGDALNSYGVLLANDGPRHRLLGPTLGSTRDAENDGQPSLDASGDGSDEDGVVIGQIIRGGAGQVTVNVAGATTNAWLDAWVDLNNSGIFDPVERITPAAGLAVINGANSVLFAVPSDAPDALFARFRLSTLGGLAPTGLALDGEVEDYRLPVLSLDFGDAPNSFGTTSASNGARHIATGPRLGATRDSEGDGQPGALATGDGADEDGVVIERLIQGGPTKAIVTVDTAGLGAARLDAWVDFNGNGVFDASERITDLAGTIVADGANTIFFTVPQTVTIGPAFARFRLSTAGGLTPKGSSLDGEVEDYRIDLSGRADVVGRTSTGQWWLAANNGVGLVNQYYGAWNEAAGWRDVMTGDFNNDGLEDVIGRTAGGQWWLGLNTGGAFASQYYGAWAGEAGWQDVMAGDFNSDGRLDVVGRTAGGQWWIGANTGAGFSNSLFGAWAGEAGWRDVMAGDFNGDGAPDIVGRTASGAWFLAVNNTTTLANVYFGSWAEEALWQDVKQGDFNGDGRLDVIGRTAGGQWWVGANNGATLVNQLFGGWDPFAGWRDVMTGDFNRDGRIDMLGRTQSGGWWLAANTGAGFVNQAFATWDESQGWRDVQTGDFTGDGLLDIIGRTASGVWWLGQNTSAGVVNTPYGFWYEGAGWRDVQPAEFDRRSTSAGALPPPQADLTLAAELARQERDKSHPNDQALRDTDEWLYG